MRSEDRPKPRCGMCKRELKPYQPQTMRDGQAVHHACADWRDPGIESAECKRRWNYRTFKPKNRRDPDDIMATIVLSDRGIA